MLTKIKDFLTGTQTISFTANNRVPLNEIMALIGTYVKLREINGGEDLITPILDNPTNSEISKVDSEHDTYSNFVLMALLTQSFDDRVRLIKDYRDIMKELV